MQEEPPEGAPEGGSLQQLSHAELQSMLRTLTLHLRHAWTPPRCANVDAVVLKRLVGLEPFVCFARSDPHARGLLIQAAFDMAAVLKGRLQLLLTADKRSGGRWLLLERKSCCAALALLHRGVLRWGDALLAEAVTSERLSGPQLLMLQAVCCSRAPRPSARR